MSIEMSIETSIEQKSSAKVQFGVGELHNALQNYINGLEECADDLQKARLNLALKSISSRRVKKRAQCVAKVRAGKLQCPKEATLRWRLGAAGIGQCANYCQHHYALLQESLVVALRVYETQIRKAIKNASALLQRMKDAEIAAKQLDSTQLEIALAQMNALAQKVRNLLANAGRELQRVYRKTNVDALTYFLGRMPSESSLEAEYDGLLKSAGLASANAVMLKSSCFGMRAAKLAGQLNITARDIAKALPDNAIADNLLEQTVKAADQLQARMTKADADLCRRIAKTDGYDVCLDRTCGPLTDQCKL